MKAPALQLDPAKPASRRAVKLPSSSLLQRKCACGGTPGPSGECVECQKKKLQRQLAIGASNDPFEMEADRVADQVMASSAPSDVSAAPPSIQRLTGPSNGEARSAPESVNRVVGSSGRPLASSLRQDMEQRFGHNFSSVRVHSGTVAEQSAQDVDAKAYTVGNHIVFGAGRFAPETGEGRRLLAHELTHVVQQNRAPVGSPSPQLQREPNEERRPPSLTPRERQVACVVRRGGCTSGTYGLPGGTANEHIPRYNSICRDSEKTGYGGPDVYPSPEECNRPPKEPLSRGAELLILGTLLVGAGLVATATIVAGAAVIPVAVAAVGDATLAAGAYYFANAIVINEAGLLLTGLLISCSGDVPGLLKALADDPVQAIPILAEVYILHTTISVARGPAQPATIPVKLLPPAEQTTPQVRFRVVGPPQYKSGPPAPLPAPATTPKTTKPAAAPAPRAQGDTNRPGPKSTAPGTPTVPKGAAPKAELPRSAAPKVETPEASPQSQKGVAPKADPPAAEAEPPKSGALKAEIPESETEPPKTAPPKGAAPEAETEPPNAASPSGKPRTGEDTLREQHAGNAQKIAQLEETIQKLEQQFAKANEKADNFLQRGQKAEAAERRSQASNLREQINKREDERNRLRSENLKLADQIDRLKTGFPSGVGPPPGKPHGGAYKDMEAWGGERNHIPPESVSKVGHDNGPAIWMEQADHLKTKSWGSSEGAQKWRAKQSSLIKQGKVREAIQMDVDDIEGQFGKEKYSKGIKQMWAYFDSLDPAAFIK